MSIRISFNDGYWYIDVRRSPAGQYKAHSRFPDLDQALEQARQIATTKQVTP
jgi:hypothetical protein